MVSNDSDLFVFNSSVEFLVGHLFNGLPRYFCEVDIWIFHLIFFLNC